MLGAIGVGTLLLLGAGGYLNDGDTAKQRHNDNESNGHSKMPDVDAPSGTIGGSEPSRLITDWGWMGEESRDVRRVNAAQSQKTYAPSLHRPGRTWTNRPITQQEEMELRRFRADALDETTRLPWQDPLRMSRDPYAARQRAIGAHHPGLTRVEQTNVQNEVSRDLLDQWPGHYQRQAEARRMGYAQQW